MKEKQLYILSFRYEPAIKVGISINAYARATQMGADAFDLSKSYLIGAKDSECVRVLERNLKTFFAREARRNKKLKKAA